MKISLTTRICAVIVFLALIAFWLLVGFGIYTNGFQSFKARYIACDGRAVNTENSVELCNRSPVFKLTGAGFKAVDWGEYTFSITANPQAEITYEISGEEFEAEDIDLTAGFKIDKQEKEFTIISGDYSLQTVLKTVTGKEVTIINFSKTEAPYILTVTDSNVKIYTCMLAYIKGAIGITIEPDKLIVG